MSFLSKNTIEPLNSKDESAFQVMFCYYYPRLVYFAKEYVSYEDAKGIVQESFISFLEKTPTFFNEYQLRSYLYTLVKNSCLMHLRHQKVKTNYINKVNGQVLQSQVYQSALEQLDTSEITFREMESIIKNTLDSLAPRPREVFILSRYEGKKNVEIAVLLGISIKTVEAHITNTLKIFRVSLKDFLPLFSFLL